MKNIIIAFVLTSFVYAKDTDILWRTSMYSTISTFYIANILGIDEGGITIGIDGDTMLNSLELKWHKKDISHNLGAFTLKYYYRASYEIWNEKGSKKIQQNNTLSINPLFRIEYKNIHIDYSMGITIMSLGIKQHSKYSDKFVSIPIGIKQHSQHSGKFAFNHILAIGFYINKIYLQGSFKHYSNNGIYEQNNGANFFAVNIGYRY